MSLLLCVHYALVACPASHLVVSTWLSAHYSNGKLELLDFRPLKIQFV